MGAKAKNKKCLMVFSFLKKKKDLVGATLILSITREN